MPQDRKKRSWGFGVQKGIIVCHSARLYFPDTQPISLSSKKACHPFAAVAMYGKTVPFFTAVMREKAVLLPLRMFTVPPEHTMITLT